MLPYPKGVVANWAVRWLFPVIISLTMISASCTVGVTLHNEGKAASQAAHFLDAAIINRDFRTAYGLANESFRASSTFEEFKDFLEAMHGEAFPSRILIKSYETYGTKEAIVIFAESESSDPRVFYKLTYVGTGRKGYELQGIRIQRDPFPKQGLHRDFSNPIVVGHDAGQR